MNTIWKGVTEEERKVAYKELGGRPGPLDNSSQKPAMFYLLRELELMARFLYCWVVAIVAICKVAVFIVAILGWLAFPIWLVQIWLGQLPSDILVSRMSLPFVFWFCCQYHMYRSIHDGSNKTTQPTAFTSLLNPDDRAGCQGLYYIDKQGRKCGFPLSSGMYRY